MPGFNLNTVTLSGGLTFDPELRALPSGTSVCKLRLAYTERVKDGATGEWSDRSNYIDIVVWAGMGEWCARELVKGAQVVIVGRLRWYDWEDKDTGKKRSATEIVCDSIFRDRGAGGGGGRSDASFGQPPESGFAARSDVPVDTGAASGFAPAGSPASAPAPAPADDDIPF